MSRRFATRGDRFWTVRFRAEFTFYHEVGYHVCGHVEGGTVAEQEREADAYAAWMLWRPRPVLRLVRLMLLPVLWLLKRWATKEG
ncbi:MAG: hypothetical protein AAGA87_07245 [Pseudomonadota bacterium]